jgi:hypothetical protein
MTATYVEANGLAVSQRWLFSRTADLAAFGGSAALALALVAVGAANDWLHSDTPEWTWVTAILLVDVAHVYATGFRVYFVPQELKRRPWLYGLTPALGWLIGVSLYSEGEVIFWQVLAYLAVFHFVRQQYGWVALYRARAHECDRWGALVDAAAIYMATLWPLVWWHAHLPRAFWWFREHDFLAVPPSVPWATLPLYVGALASYFIRTLYRGFGVPARIWWCSPRRSAGSSELSV